ncbi:MAG TPA: ABC transporter ATP-binding protein [Candidatus Obscuribacterales bacterium]
MAKVVLENVYKSFSHRAGQTSARPSGGAMVSDGAAPVAAIADPVEESADKRQSHVSVLRRIQLTVHDGEFMVLVGPSGCGKSTLLRLIAGLETLTGGNIWVGDRLVNELPPKARDIAMVFQNYALYPHLTVYNNLAFGLRRAANSLVDPQKADDQRSLPPWLEKGLVAATRPLPRLLRYWSSTERAIDQRVLTVAEMLQIQQLLDRLPKQLSGGQKQRVALGRAMARNPAVFLMDEPLSNLDAKLRIETRSQIVNLQRRLGITTIYVTHDQTEAMTMGDRIAVMNAGQIQQLAAPLTLYNHPVNRFVAEFIGTLPMNFLTVAVTAPLLITHNHFRLTIPDTWEDALRRYDGRSLLLGIRPEHLSVSVPAPKNLPVTVERVEALGSETYLSVRLGHGTVSDRITLQARIEPDRPVSIGEELWLAIAVDKLHLFDPDTENAIA